MKLGEKSNDPVKLWRELSIPTRRDISLTFWTNGTLVLTDWAVEVISKKFHCREQSVKHWPKEKRAQHLADIGTLNGTLVLDILRTHFFACQKPMMASFLDSLGIDHEDCSIHSNNDFTPNEDSLRKSISYLIREFPKDQVELYLRILLCQGPTWAALAEIDLGDIQPADRPFNKVTPMPDKSEGLATPTLEVQVTLAVPVISELKDNFESVRDAFNVAADVVDGVASKLRLGVLPDANIDHTAAELRIKREEVSNALVAFAKRMGLELTKESLTSFSEFEELMARIENAQKTLDDQRRILQEACGIYESVLKLERKDGREFPALRNCQDIARLMQNRFAGEQVELDEGAIRKVHAFKTLLSMVENRKGIGEDESALAYDEIGREFGTSIVLAIERGLIVLSDGPSAKHGNESEVTGFVKVPDDGPTDLAVPEAIKVDSHTEVSLPAPTEKSASKSESVATHAVVLVPMDDMEEEPRPVLTAHATAEDTSFHELKGQTSQAFAAELLATQSDPDDVEIQRLALLALSEQKVSATYHLVSCLERLRPNSPRSISSPLIRSLALGLEIRQPHGHIATQLKTDFGYLAASLESDSDSQTFAYHLVSVCAALCPSISAPGSGGLRSLKLSLPKVSGLKNLYTLCGLIADYASAQFVLDPAALEYADNADSWSEQLSSLHQETEAWAEKARRIQLRFAPAAKVWRKWLDRGGIVYSLLSHIRDNNPASIAEIELIISRVATDNKIRSEVNTTDRQLKGCSVSGEINSTALAVIQRHTKEALDLARRWVSLQEHRPSENADYHLNKLLEVRNAVDERREAIQEEIAKSLMGTDDLRVRAALNCCRIAMQRLTALLHPNRESRRPEPDLKYVLSSDLLLIPGLTLSASWEPLVEDRVLLRLLEEFLARTKAYDWQQAFQMHAEKWRDHDATDRIIEYLTWTGEKKELVQRLADDQKTHVVSCQDALLRQVEECRKKIEIGVSRGLVRDRERSEFLQVVEGISDRASLTRNFGEAEAQLRTIVATIDRAKSTLVQQVQQTMVTRSISPGHPAYPRIMGVLESGDIDTATEYIELVSRGDSLPEKDDGQDAFGIFFPQACCEIEEFLSDPKSSSSLLSRIENQKGIPGVEMGHLSDSKAKEAVEMLEAWISLKKVKRTSQQQLRTLFERLGFNVLNVSEGVGQPRAWVTLVVKPLNHRDECPIPYFGSSANGHYRVLCIWDHPSEEEIINLIRPGRLGDAPMVLYFDQFTDMKRRNLASLSRIEHLSFLFIDEILILFLCSEANARLPVLFNCALPFTFTNPYSTTSSLVPPEMFYGRRYERTQIIDPMGSCFVYGGRQLGKTALLISIRDEFHDPTEGRIAIWFDLKAAGITQDDLWSSLGQAFASVQVAGLDLEKKRSDHAVIEQLQSWLDGDEKRRILLLLDEADRFLESDSRDSFKRTSSLKGLMERTNRRFKVVFAGLHNVQRTTKQENQPLAHFGQPICIGPLLDGGEWKAAKGLIEQPLKSMGYRFESPDSVTRILAQTNYYPSLIQLYCNQLFQHLNRESPASFDWKLSPPYLITTKHVEDAYTSRQLRNAIRERFELTLNLDLRYRVIALIIALYGESNENPALGTMSVSEIRSLATDFWERGFLDCRSEESFRVLLEEMVGLGVLQEVDGRFALRTPNVKSLLGTEDEIEAKLVRSALEEPAPAFEAHVFRTSDQKEVWKRNPLTVIQESSLRAEKNAVTVLFGTRAAGLDDVALFLTRAFGNDSYFICGKEISDRDYFQARLVEIKDKLKAGISLILIQGCPWTQSWVEEAIAWISKLKTVSKFVNVTFVADPLTAWHVMQNFRRLDELQSDRRLAIHSLQTWHDSVLWQWLGDCRIGTNATDEKALISEKTGNWPYLLMEFGKRATGEPDWKRFLNDLYSKLDNRATNPEYAEAFGLTIPEPRKILNEMALLGGKISIADLASLLDTVPQSAIENTIHWADRLSLLKCSSRGEWELDPIVVKVLPFEC